MVVTLKQILIVEDDRDINDLLVEFLKDSSFRVETTFDGAEALEKIKEGLRPNLILLDLMMPEMDGFTFLEEIKKIPDLGKIPSILMSADPRMDQSLPARASVYIKKPLDIYYLLTTINDLLQKAELRIEKSS